MEPPVSKIPTSLIFLLIIIAVVNALAEAHHWYWKMRWFDMPMHFASGMWLAGIALWWYYFRRGMTPRRLLPILGVGLFLAIGVGFSWEVYQSTIDIIKVGHIHSMKDTLSDLLFDILGGTTLAVSVYLKAKYKNKLL